MNKIDKDKVYTYYFSIKVDGKELDTIVAALKDDSLSNYEKNITYLYPAIYKRINNYLKKILDNEEIFIHKIRYVIFANKNYNYITIFFILDYGVKFVEDYDLVRHIFDLSTINFVYKQSYLEMQTSSDEKIYDSDFRTVKGLTIQTKDEKEKYEKIISLIDEFNFIRYEEKERFKLYLLKNNNNVSNFLEDNLKHLFDIQKKLLKNESKEIIKTKTFLFKKFTFSKSLIVEKTIDDKMNEEFKKNIDIIDSWGYLTSFASTKNKTKLEEVLNELQNKLLLSFKNRFTIFDILLINDFDKKIKKIITYLDNISENESLDTLKINAKLNELINNFISFHIEFNKIIEYIYKEQSFIKKIDINEAEVLSELENLKF